MSTRHATTRDPIKHAFLDTLTGEERDYLRSKKGKPSRDWRKEPMALDIVKRAHGQGTFAIKTIPMDVLTSLRNFINRP